ncbi:uncharacterized protein PV09_01941 [Verruconis gallopava]|uniref:Cdc23 domain-containing protein n=1 Tax=Verruconis gallopava TaxID=253628 RepID=A0A0D2AKH0_9PEZI|nr:uncharacterized protein PV09_01941 [Verruconis gallopava]KIW07050.1 hypothetical protein PV09_01941 [Verruconis gallopava]
MSKLSDAQVAELQFHLQGAVQSCIDRCLYQSAKWAAELLNSLPPSDDGSDTEADSPTPARSVKPASFEKPAVDLEEARLESKEQHKYLLAKTFFDCREFDRCAAVFLPQTLPQVPKLASSSPPSAKKGKGKAKTGNTPTKQKETDKVVRNVSQRSLFLALYAKYLSGEKKKDEESEMILGPCDGPVTPNRQLNSISAVLEQYFSERHAENKNGGGWLEYLYGVVLAKAKDEEMAKEWLIQSVNIYPFNWGAWQELQNLIGSVEELDQVLERLPRNIMTFIFHIHTSQELFQTDSRVFAALSQIQSFFPTSLFLQTQRALLHYHAKDHEEAASIFTSILEADPYRLDAMDSYSNCLYVLEARPRLAFLAHLASATDKFRPETCCIIGNYYSLLSEHEKAVIYFRRALQLDRSFLTAWTLMGHEFVEMKNSHAALEAYRRAVDVNRKDYRAWYGMGQTYEMLKMHSYALYYYQRASALRPFDAKIWGAVAACFARIGKVGNAIRAYKRALVAGSWYEGSGTRGGADTSFGSEGSGLQGLAGGVLDPDCLYQIALLYERMGEVRECSAYMELCLAQEEGPGNGDDFDEDDAGSQQGGGGVGVTATTSKARMWLAKWAYSRGDYARALELATELCEDGVEVEEAKALQRDVRAREEAERA